MTPVHEDKGPTSGSRSLQCARCGIGLSRGRGECYVVEIRAVADPSPPVFTQDDLERDTEHAIDELLARLRSMSEEQLIGQVYSRGLYYLCGPCYTQWVEDPFGGRGEAHSRSST
jgi:hypothetical protein